MWNASEMPPKANRPLRIVHAGTDGSRITKLCVAVRAVAPRDVSRLGLSTRRISPWPIEGGNSCRHPPYIGTRASMHNNVARLATGIGSVDLSPGPVAWVRLPKTSKL